MAATELCADCLFCSCCLQAQCFIHGVIGNKILLFKMSSSSALQKGFIFTLYSIHPACSLNFWTYSVSSAYSTHVSFLHLKEHPLLSQQWAPNCLDPKVLKYNMAD